MTTTRETKNSSLSETSPESLNGTENASNSASSVTIDELSATLNAERPEVQRHVIEQAQAEAASQVENNCDAAGTPYSETLHTGTKTSKGLWRARKGASSATSVPDKSTGSKLGNVNKGNPTSAITQTSAEISARAGGKAAANLVLAFGVGFGGEEWHPRYDAKIGLDEKTMLETVFGDYFVATGKTDIPPGWALVAGLSMYALPRFAMPQTKARVGKVRAWIGAKIVAWKARRSGLRVTVKSQGE